MSTVDRFTLLEDRSYSSSLELTLRQVGPETFEQACVIESTGHWSLDATLLVITLDDAKATLRSIVRNGEKIDPMTVPEESRCPALAKALPKGFAWEFVVQRIASDEVDVSDRMTGKAMTWHRRRPR